MTGTGEPELLLGRADALARELAKREVDHNEFRRVGRFLARNRDLGALEGLLKSDAPRRAGRGREHWRAIRELVRPEVQKWRQQNLDSEAQAARLAYVLGWAARLQQYYEPPAGPGRRRGRRS